MTSVISLAAGMCRSLCQPLAAYMPKVQTVLPAGDPILMAAPHLVSHQHSVHLARSATFVPWQRAQHLHLQRQNPRRLLAPAQRQRLRPSRCPRRHQTRRQGSAPAPPRARPHTRASCGRSRRRPAQRPGKAARAPRRPACARACAPLLGQAGGARSPAPGRSALRRPSSPLAAQAGSPGPARTSVPAA